MIPGRDFAPLGRKKEKPLPVPSQDLYHNPEFEEEVPIYSGSDRKEIVGTFKVGNRPLPQGFTSAAQVENNKRMRQPYLEAREVVAVEKKERQAIDRQIQKESHNICSVEWESVEDCHTENQHSWFVYQKCRAQVQTLNRCLRRLGDREFVQKRRSEIAKQRILNGQSHLRMAERSSYNNLCVPEEVHARILKGDWKYDT